MKKFLKILNYIFFKPFTAIAIFLASEHYIRFINKHGYLKHIFALLITALFFFLIFILPDLAKSIWK